MRLTSAAIATLVALTGCMTAPTGPTIFALPGRDKTLEQFTADDGRCRQYASERLGAVAQDNALDMQRRYDTAYVQCMYAAGHRVPVAGIFASQPPGSPPPPPGPPGSAVPLGPLAPPVPYVPPPPRSAAPPPPTPAAPPPPPAQN
jgi:hypothetical protein